MHANGQRKCRLCCLAPFMGSIDVYSVKGRIM